ncbi:MAG: transcription-repair coupling factor [Pseudomonadota bacterium]|nr:transcription-repair coupling factor [Pseudomonadota bacterium]QKK06439.1 MAG: transcription-repair coupling factor [Pseudomonadota bacterium]
MKPELTQRENLENIPAYRDFRKHYGVVAGAEALVLKALAADTSHPPLYIAADEEEMRRVEMMLGFLGVEADIICFPAWDCLPYDRVSPTSGISGARLEALSYLLHRKKDRPVIILTTVNAVVQKVLPRSVLKETAFDIKKSGFLDMEALTTYLAANGYHRVETVREAGEYAVRGSIFDIFPANEETPLRIDLFGEEIESLKYFDPLSQRSTGEAAGFSLQPVSEIFLNEKTIKRFRGAYRELFGAVTQKEEDPVYNAVSEGRKTAGLEHWLPLFYEEMEVLPDYVPEAVLVFGENAEAARQSRLEQIYDFYEARRENMAESSFSAPYKPIPAMRHYIDHNRWAEILTAAEAVHLLLPFPAPGEGKTEKTVARRGRDFSDVRVQDGANVYDALITHIRALLKDDRRVLIAGYSEGACKRMQTVLEQHGFGAVLPVGSFDSLSALKKNMAGTAVLPLERGFEATDFTVITEQDILGDRLVRPAGQKKKSRKLQDVLEDLSVLNDGDYVVHEEHGIGVFSGLETLSVGHAAHDFLKILYAGGDKLYVPVEHIEVLSRYGSDSVSVALDRLGGAGWQSRKAKIKKDLLAMAEELMKIAAARILNKTDSLHVADGLYQEFSAGFPYPETEDQENAIKDVIADLEQDHAMDRLICGDVGFGKTEVALRGAFVAAMSGVQVAILAPTTLLCRQHYQGFHERFRGFGLKIAQLSRLVSAKEAKQTREGLKDGSINIVVGTHALLSDKIDFAHLGLLVVDEEQRFGVKQKEKLKKLRSQVHVLTMTATPIPRTMQLSMAGVRDMSLITTPPVDRLAVRTYVSVFDSVIIREALMREHHRGGQSFYVCPRVADISKLEKQLKELVPELKFVTAHGQMATEELENRVSAFYDGKYDILLATTIIESGLDIPNANTMVIHRADMFGLAQLYQLRGRIGRSKQRGYAYLTYDARKPLTKTALQRLEVIERLDTLGAGFQLASHDLDIRGAGNLLGEDQSGHIREIGVELYQKMLEEAVAEIRFKNAAGSAGEEQTVRHEWTPQINLGIAVMIPERYVGDLHLRLSLYRRLGGLETEEEIDGFAAEMIDRFGDLPGEVENLLQTVTIKHLCRRAGVEKLEAGPKGATVSFYKNEFAAVERLVGYIQRAAGTVKLRPDQSLAYIRSWDDPALRVQGSKRILQELIALLEGKPQPE